MIKAIFLDVDGTLISFKTHRVPASALEALREAHARGVQLFIATGRAAADLADLEAIPYDGVAALNGADCLMRDGRVVARHPIPRADFEKSLALSAELDFPVGLELNDGVFVNRVTPEVVRLAEMVAHPVPEQVDLRALFDRGDCCQMCFYFDPELEKRVMAELPSLVASRWCPIFADVNVRGVDKATGMAEFAAHFGFANGETMAFGDGGNDVAMLRAAGAGVAMGNACDEGLAAAREELHRSFATLSQDDQRFAELFLHDVERGDAVLEDGMTLRDYITSYARKAKNAQVERVVEALGIDGELLATMAALDLAESNINEFGRFDDLKDSVDKARAKAFFEQKEGKTLPLFKVNTRAAALLKKFILEGGFDIDE